MDYDWREDIIDIVDDLDIPSDTKDDLFYRAAERIVVENGIDYYDGDTSDAVMEEMSSIIGLFAVPQDTVLYDLVMEWHGGYDNMMENVRNCFEDNENLYFVTGTGYSLFDADLLGGSGNGETVARFDEFVRNHD